MRSTPPGRAPCRCMVTLSSAIAIRRWCASLTAASGFWWRPTSLPAVWTSNPLALVVNFELAWDPEVHVHRIGRTARAGEQGLAISFCAPEEAQRATILADMLQLSLNWLPAPTGNTIAPLTAEMATLCIDGGKKAKMRPGDVLGALTGDMGFDGADIGKITVHPAHVYVAIRQNMAQKAYKQLQNGKIKGKSCRVRLLK